MTGAQYTNTTPKIGEIYLMEFNGSYCEQGGLRPGIVFQNNIGNEYSPNIIALPLTCSMKKLGQPTHVLLKATTTGLRKDSVVLCENPERMSKEKMGRYITRLDQHDMKKITEANLLATSAIAYLDIDRIIHIWEHASSLNAGVTQPT